MATFLVPVSISAGGNHIKSGGNFSSMAGTFFKAPVVTIQGKSNRSQANRSLSVHAEYNDRSSGSGSDFVAGFLLGGAIFGTLAYVFAPQIRRSLLNEDESGFRRAKRPIYYDGGLEKTRETLNEKISQLNSAIDNVSTRLRGGNNLP